MKITIVAKVNFGKNARRAKKFVVIFCQPQPLRTYNLNPSRSLHCEAKSGIMRQASDDEKHLVLVWV